MKKKEGIIAEFVAAIFVLASVLSAFFAGILIENTTMSFILLFIAIVFSLIRVTYEDEKEIVEE